MASSVDGAACSRQEELPCREWEYDLPDGVHTVVSEWNLVCGDAWRLLLLTVYTHLGGMVCAPFVGSIADRLGRQPVILTCALSTVAGAAFAAYALSFFGFVVSRMLVAASLAGFCLTSIVLLFEVTSEASRSNYLCGALLAIALGSWLPCLLQDTALDHRTVSSAFLGVTSLLLLSLVGIHESARWLLASWDAVGSEKYSPGARLSVYLEAELDRLLRQQRADRQLINAGVRRHTAASVTASIGLLRVPTFWARLLVLSTIFLSQFTILHSLYPCGQRESPTSLPVWQTTVLLVPRVTGLCMSSWLLNRWERKRALRLGISISCATMTFLLAMAGTHELVAFALSEALYTSVLVNGAVACVYSLELYPTYNRATGIGSTFSLTALAVSVLPLMDSYELVMRQMCGLCLAVGALILVSLLPETKDVKLPETAFDVPSTIGKRYSLSTVSKASINPVYAGCRKQTDPREQSGQ